MHRPPGDLAQRVAAVTTFDRNVLVVAGAGTGKTALLTARALVYLLGESYARNPARTPAQRADEVLALTFTDKAAAEMGERLVCFLTALAHAETPDSLEGSVHELVWEPLAHRWGLSEKAIRQRALEALEHVERVETSTIHTFCSSLLHRFPFEAGVCPGFEVDTEGAHLDTLLDQTWDRHVRDQLGDSARVSDAWRIALGAGLDLTALRAFAKALIASRVPTEMLLDPATVVGDPDAHAAPLRSALPGLKRLAETIGSLGIRANGRLPRFATVLPAMARALGEVGGRPAVNDAQEWRTVLKDGPQGLFNQTVSEKIERAGLSEAELAVEVEHAMESVEEAWSFTPVELAAVHEVCAPVVNEVRRRAAQEGALGFEHLLLHAAALITHNPRLAARLRQRYRCVLLDEVQDTDPLQYDIIKPFRGEGPSLSWGAQGTFVVGDPKQSIYLFRDADIEAFGSQAAELAQGGLAATIDANFRSDPRIISVVNAVCRRLFSTGDYPRLFQPPYEALRAHLPEGDEPPPVEVVRVTVAGDTIRAPDCAEAEVALVVEQLRRIHGQGYRWRDMVVLAPTRTGIDALCGALQEAGIPAVHSGGRSFYGRQEVLDTVHLLAGLANPGDKGALAAFLGSVAGGVSNEDLVTLCAAGLCDDFTYLDVAAHDPPEGHPGLWGLDEGQRRRIAGVLAQLARLHRRIAESETWHVFQDLTQSLPVVEAWGFSRFGSQRMANVDKLLDEVESRVRGGASLATVVREMVERELVEREGEEGALASPTLDAVTIETIHGAKGLEFPVVILANLLRRVRTEKEKDVFVAREWTTGTVAVKAYGLRNHAARRSHLSRKHKREAELARLLYVALTRAKQRLVVFLHPSTTGTTYSSMLQRAMDDALAAGELADGRELTIMERSVQEAIPGETVPVRRPPVPVHEIVHQIGRRREALITLSALPLRLTPSSGDEPYPRRELPAEEREAPPETRDRALRFGDLCHSVLEHLDLRHPLEDLERALEAPLSRRISGELYDELVGEARRVLAAAIGAPFFRQAILGADRVVRELPVLEHVGDATMSGRIDLAARSGTAWIVVDFKTDREIAPPEELIARYGGQKEAYSRVLGRALGLSEAPRFFLYFLRHCAAVEL